VKTVGHWNSLDELIYGPPGEVVGQCDGCGDELYRGQTVLTHEHRVYCSMECLREALGIRRMDAEEAVELIYGGGDGGDEK